MQNNQRSCIILLYFLTARIEEMDAIIGFQSGGDDYVVKPFRLGELGARVEAHLRRESRGGVWFFSKNFLKTLP